MHKIITQLNAKAPEGNKPRLSGPRPTQYQWTNHAVHYRERIKYTKTVRSVVVVFGLNKYFILGLDRWVDLGLNWCFVLGLDRWVDLGLNRCFVRGLDMCSVLGLNMSFISVQDMYFILDLNVFSSSHWQVFKLRLLHLLKYWSGQILTSRSGQCIYMLV